MRKENVIRIGGGIMEREKRQEFSARITQANRSELLVIVYEIVQEELTEALAEFEKQELQKFDISLQNAQKFLNELMGTLNYEYEISYQLLSIYRFVNKIIIEARIKRQDKDIEVCIRLLEKLRHAYAEVASKDQAGPMMSNVQKLYSGLTYGKGALSEVSVDVNGGHRGLYA